MLPDPLVLSHGQDLFAFNRIAAGRFRHDASNLDRPAFLDIQAQVNSDKISNYLVKWVSHHNVGANAGSVSNQMQSNLADAKLQMHLVLRVPHQHVSVGEVDTARKLMIAFLTHEEYFSRLLIGET